MVVPNPEVVAGFYAAVVGYTLDPCKEGANTSYSLVDSNNREVFGICDQKSFPNWTGGWVLYIEVDNFEDRVKRIHDHGGEIVGRWGGEEGRRRECLFRDPSGAGVMLQESPENG